MATRRGIAEQILRIISGGDPTPDLDISVKEIMFLVDQERDAMIKAEILDSMYTKGVANSKGELEILGQYLSKRVIPLLGGVKNGTPLYGVLPGLISLPKDMAVQSVFSHQSEDWATAPSPNAQTPNLGENNIPKIDKQG